MIRRAWKSLTKLDQIRLTALLALLFVQLVLAFVALARGSRIHTPAYPARHPQVRRTRAFHVRPPLVSYHHPGEEPAAEIRTKGVDCSRVAVFFGSVRAKIVSCKKSKIVVSVPPCSRGCSRWDTLVTVRVGYPKTLPTPSSYSSSYSSSSLSSGPGSSSDSRAHDDYGREVDDEEYFSTQFAVEDVYYTYAAVNDSAKMCHEPRNVALAWIPELTPQTRSVLRIFLSHLPEAWSFQIISPASLSALFRQDADIGHAMATGRLSVQETIAGHPPYADRGPGRSAALTDPLFWQSVHGDRALLFRPESVLCNSAGAAKIDEFFAYDYVGAPWCWSAYLGGSGSLSLRNVSATIRFLRDHSAYFAAVANTTGGRFAEDARACKVATRERLNYAPRAVSAAFAAESFVGVGTPFGVFRPWLWLGEADLKGLVETCPELRYILPADTSLFGSLKTSGKCVSAKSPTLPAVSEKDLLSDDVGCNKLCYALY